MFGNLFSREEAESDEKMDSPLSGTSKFAPNTKIAYKPTLIRVLQKKNLELIDLYDQAAKAAHSRETRRAKKILSQFRYMFVQHVLHENTSLYVYLQHSAKDRTSKESIRYMKSEMDKATREVIKFMSYGVKKSIAIDNDFLQRMDHVSEILRYRITEEENFVYPNYLAKGQYDH